MISIAAPIAPSILDVLIEKLRQLKELPSVAYVRLSDVKLGQSAQDVTPNLEQVLRGSNEEFDFLLHCLEEKKMTNWIIDDLEGQVGELKTFLDKERYLHLETLTHLETTSPTSMKSMLHEQSRLRAAIHDGIIHSIKSENLQLKSQLSQCHSDLFASQQTIQTLLGRQSQMELEMEHYQTVRGYQDAQREISRLRESNKDLLFSFAASITKFEAEIQERDRKIAELARSDDSEDLAQQLEEVTDNYRLSEYELETLKEAISLKNQQILDLEEHIGILNDDIQEADGYYQFMENNVNMEHKKSLEILKYEHEDLVGKLNLKIEKLERDLRKSTETNVTEQPDMYLDIARTNFMNASMDNARLREKLAIVRLEFEICSNKAKGNEQLFNKEKRDLREKLATSEAALIALQQSHHEELRASEEKYEGIKYKLTRLDDEYIKEAIEKTRFIAQLKEENAKATSELARKIESLEQENAALDAEFCNLQEEKLAQNAEKDERIAELGKPQAWFDLVENDEEIGDFDDGEMSESGDDWNSVHESDIEAVELDGAESN